MGKRKQIESQAIKKRLKKMFRDIRNGVDARKTRSFRQDVATPQEKKPCQS